MSLSTYQFTRAMPVLPISDMKRSIVFYRDKLGFSFTTWGEPPTFAILQRGSVTLALSVVPAGGIGRSGVWSCYIYVQDVDAVYADFVEHGVMAEPPQTRTPVYNCRDFTIDDPDGNAIGIGQVLTLDQMGPGLSARVGRDEGAGG